MVHGGSKPPGKGHGGKGRGKRWQSPKKFTPFEYGRMRSKLVQDPSFVRAGLRTLNTVDPALVKVFKGVFAQVKLSETGVRQVNEQLALTAVEAEMFKRVLSPNWGASRISFMAETKKGQARITIEKKKKGWEMNIQSQSIT